MTSAPVHPARYADSRQVVGETDMPSVYRRGRVYWCHFKDWTGVRRTISLNVHELRAARLLANQLEHKHEMVRLGMLAPAAVELSERTHKPVAPLVDEYLQFIGGSKDAGTILGAMLANSKLKTAAAFGSREIIGAVHEYLQVVRSRGVQRRRLQDHLRTIRNFGQWLEDNNYIWKNEVRSARVGAARDSRVIVHRALLPRELQQLSKLQERGLWYLFLAFTGARGEEAIKIKWSDFELSAAPAVHIRPDVSKTGAAAAIPLAPCLAAALARGMRLNTGRTFEGVPVRREDRRNLLAVDCRACSIDGAAVNQRSFRMTFTTWLQNSGADDTTVAQLRRDCGRGSERLRRVNYSDMAQRLPLLRGAIVNMQNYYENELRGTALGTA